MSGLFNAEVGRHRTRYPKVFDTLAAMYRIVFDEAIDLFSLLIGSSFLARENLKGIKLALLKNSIELKSDGLLVLVARKLVMNLKRKLVLELVDELDKVITKLIGRL